MSDVRRIAEEIVAREGGYVDDPDDPGGATKFGVTVHTMRRLGLDLDADGAVGSSDVRKLSQAQATDIMIRHYFEAPRIGDLPACIQPSVFDMYVNAGANAVKVLQRLLNEMQIAVTVDGEIGPKTVRASTEAEAAAPGHFADAYGIARRNYYYALGDRRPASRKFACRRDGSKGGWILRAEAFISRKYHLTDQEHRQRTASWR